MDLEKTAVDVRALTFYHKMRGITEDYHHYSDQIWAIAKWVAVEFEYNANKEDEIKKIKDTISMLNSMVIGGENHSMESLNMVSEAMSILINK